jgi:DNA polymerase-3 subunit delta'
MDLLRAGISAAVRNTVRGRADGEQRRFVALRPLEAWGDVWHALTSLQDETERLNLDKRQAILSSMDLLRGPTSDG